MASLFAFGCLFAAAPAGVALELQEMAVQAFDSVMRSDECGTGRDSGSCALELLQLGARGRHAHGVGAGSAQAIGDAHSDGGAAWSSWLKSNPEQWPELFASDKWTWNVPVPVKIVAWTGQFYLSSGIVHETTPLCTFEYLSTHKDAFPYNRTVAEAEFITSDPDTDISDADVVLFYLPYLKRNKVFPRSKRDGQLWIATCGEPRSRPATNMDCSLLDDPETMARMDGVASYEATSDFPTYQDPPSEVLMRKPPPNFAERGPGLATMAFSDCKSQERHDWLKGIKDRFDELGRSDALLSYGKCFHNAEEPDVHQCKQKWHDQWTNRCASRPFKLVAENTIQPWYITEKIWDAFVEGAIPVYMGPAEIKELVPPNSILLASDFESPQKLADAMLDFSQADFARFREWKQRPVSEWGGYANARKNSHYTFLPRLCEVAAAAKV